MALKFLQAMPVIVIISILAFLLLSLLPGDPAIIIAGEQASPAAIEQVRRQLGLDRPFFEQLAIWLFNLARRRFRLLADPAPERALGGGGTPAGHALALPRCRFP